MNGGTSIRTAMGVVRRPQTKRTTEYRQKIEMADARAPLAKRGLEYRETVQIHREWLDPGKHGHD